jgi:hypothetical protein
MDDIDSARISAAAEKKPANFGGPSWHRSGLLIQATAFTMPTFFHAAR